jgi:hypothetical protein
MTAPDSTILTEPLQHVVALGLDMFAEELTDQGVAVVRVDWRPPAEIAEKAHRLLVDLED